MREYEQELLVGDVVHIGEMTLTVIDIDGPDVSFRIDSHQAEAAELHIASTLQPPPK